MPPPRQRMSPCRVDHKEWQVLTSLLLLSLTWCQWCPWQALNHLLSHVVRVALTRPRLWHTLCIHSMNSQINWCHITLMCHLRLCRLPIRVITLTTNPIRWKARLAISHLISLTTQLMSSSLTRLGGCPKRLDLQSIGRLRVASFNQNKRFVETKTQMTSISESNLNYN